MIIAETSSTFSVILADAGPLADEREAVFETFRMRDVCAAQTHLVTIEK